MDRTARKVLRRFVKLAEPFDDTYSICPLTGVTDGAARGEDLRRARKAAVADALASLGMKRSQLVGRNCDLQAADEVGARSRAVFIQ